MRDRPEVEARFLARQVPPEARVVALAFSGGEAERAARAADAAAAGVARRREHTLLVCCEGGGSALDAILDASESPGLLAALAGEERLTAIALRREDRPYVYLPAGGRSLDPEALRPDGSFAAFVRRVRERGGTLLLFASEELLAVRAFSSLLDGYVALGDVYTRPATPGVPQLARLDFEEARAATGARSARGGADETVRPPAPEASPEPGTEPGAVVAAASPESGAEPGAANAAEPAPSTAGADKPTAESAGEGLDRPSDGEARPGGWRRHRAPVSPPLARIAAGVAIVALLLVGWWAVAREAAAPGPAGGSVDVASADEVDLTVDGEALLAAVDGSPELPYSVLIASYAAAADARERIDRLRQADEGLFFIAPTPVRGAIYHRVFAGARAGPEAGRALMEGLVASGRKETASAWDVRPAGLTFRLGLFASEGAARRAAEALEEKGVPAYVLPAGEDAARAWQVLAGAYESRAAAGPMAALLEREGLAVDLVTRRGEDR